MRHTEQEEVRLCCWLAVVSIKTADAQACGSGDWEKGGARTSEEKMNAIIPCAEV